jgi:hypothetical protein
MDEPDLWLIELFKLCRLYQYAIRKRICITCKGQTCLVQLQQTGKLQMGLGLVVLNNASNNGWMNRIYGR